MTTHIEGSIYDTLRRAFGNERAWPHDDTTIPRVGDELLPSDVVIRQWLGVEAARPVEREEGQLRIPGRSSCSWPG